MWIKEIKAVAILLVVTMLMLACADSAYAIGRTSSEERTARVIEEATGTQDVNGELEELDDSIVADGDEIVTTIPKEANEMVEIYDGEDEGNNIQMALPEEIEGEKGVLTDDGTIVYGNEKNSVSVGVQALKEEVEDVSFEGVRTTIKIDSAKASKEYSFEYNLPEGSKLVTAEEYLGGADFDTGEVYVVDENGEITSIIDPAWAKDANGNAVETYYRVENGTTLVQVVNFDEETAFPVVADPSFWKVTLCVAAISGAIACVLFAPAKIAKVKKYIKSLGGIKKAVTSLMKAGKRPTAKQLKKIGGTALAGFGAIIFDIDAIKEKCF